MAGFHVKAGFCTGNKGNNFCRTISEVPSTIMSIFNRKDFDWKPYVFVQATMAHNFEIKVELFENPLSPEENDILYYTLNSKGSGPSFKSEELEKFVYYAKKRYVEEFGPDSAYPILRIDIFLRQDGRFAVNEFEHFEAKGEDGVIERNFLVKFWVAQIKKMLAEN